MIKRLYFLSMIFFGALGAQIYPGAAFSVMSSDNIFKGPDPVFDYMYLVSVSLDYLPEKSGFSFFYNGDFDFYRTYNDRNSSYHGLGLNYFSKIGRDKKNNFYLGTDFQMRINDEVYEVYDYSQFYLYGNFKFNFEALTLKTGYNFRFRNYTNYTDLSHSRHIFFVQLARTFQTKTTLKIEADFGYKKYANSEVYKPGTGTGGRSRPGYTVVESNPLTNFVIMGRAAQSIIDDVGLSAYYRQQFSLSKEGQTFNSDITNQDSELFDDPFSYESVEYGTTLKIILPWRINLDLNYGRAEKNYITENAYISDVDSIGLGGLREDDYQNFSVSIDKSFLLEASWLYSLNIYFDFHLLDNASNSYWYNYREKFYQVGVSFNF